MEGRHGRAGSATGPRSIGAAVHSLPGSPPVHWRFIFGIVPIPAVATLWDMKFEFDQRKSRANHAKHGIDFVEAQSLWTDAASVTIAARTQEEARWVVIGRIDGRAWAAVVTMRVSKVRIISVRRARPAEEALYEGE